LRRGLGVSIKTNVIYCGDCKDVLKKFPDECVDLIYVDPPFFTSKNYEIVFKDGYELRSFKDAHWYDESGRRREDIFVYLDWLKERVEEMHRVLKPTGTFYLHCDWHANAYIRVYVLDKIFGQKNFRNEIIWCYAGGGIPKKDFPRKHDTIFRYVKDVAEFEKHGTFNTEYRPYGRWVKEHEPRHSLTTGGTPLDLERGTPINDWWSDLKRLTSYQKEWWGFPTQKPESLLKRIIKTSSNPLDIVLDPMCGCGTTLVAAHRLGRRWIGIDISPTGCKLTRDRLRKSFSELNVNPPPIIGLPMTIEDLKKMSWADFQNLVCEKINGRSAEKKTRDKGIDGWTYEGYPIQVKQSENVGRPTIDKFETALRRYYAGSKKKIKGIIIAFSFTSDAYEEAKRAKLEDGIEIELKTVREIIHFSDTEKERKKKK